MVVIEYTLIRSEERGDDVFETPLGIFRDRCEVVNYIKAYVEGRTKVKFPESNPFIFKQTAELEYDASSDGVKHRLFVREEAQYDVIVRRKRREHGCMYLFKSTIDYESSDEIAVFTTEESALKYVWKYVADNNRKFINSSLEIYRVSRTIYCSNLCAYTIVEVPCNPEFK